MAGKANEMDHVLETMMEHVCDDICRFRKEVTTQEDLEAVCAECEMGQHICNILNCYQAVEEKGRFPYGNDGMVSTTDTGKNEV